MPPSDDAPGWRGPRVAARITDDERHRAESLARHEAAEARDRQIEDKVGGIDAKVDKLADEMRTEMRAMQSALTVISDTHTTLVETVSGKGGLREAVDKMRGAAIAMSVVGAAIISLAGWALYTTSANDRSIAVHDTQIAGLADETEDARRERSELRVAVTEAANAVARVAATVEAVDERVDDVEDEQRAMRSRPSGGR
jgi:hypothetical protein